VPKGGAKALIRVSELTSLLESARKVYCDFCRVTLLVFASEPLLMSPLNCKR